MLHNLNLHAWGVSHWPNQGKVHAQRANEVRPQYKPSSVTASQTQMKTKTNSKVAWGFPHATPTKECNINNNKDQSSMGFPHATPTTAIKTKQNNMEAMQDGSETKWWTDGKNVN